MKTRIKIAALAAACLMVLSALAACAIPPESDPQPAGQEAPVYEAQGETMDIDIEMIPLSQSPPPRIEDILPVASGTQVSKNAKAEIDYSNAKDGYVMIKVAKPTQVKTAVRITGPDENMYTYFLRNDGQYEAFPLSSGNGKYTVGVYEQVQGSKYATAATATVNVTLASEFAPFLRPNQYVYFNKDTKAVAKAAELVGGKSDVVDRVSAVYNYVVSSLSYDKELAKNVKTGYVPDLDNVMAKGKGICFDYASLMTAMLRSQGVPTRLVIGYAGTAYHAWIDVHSEDKGWINNIIQFDGKKWILMDPTFASSGNNSAAVMQYIGDGNNYEAKHLF